jgi:hypothetical protein
MSRVIAAPLGHADERTSFTAYAAPGTASTGARLRGGAKISVGEGRPSIRSPQLAPRDLLVNPPRDLAGKPGEAAVRSFCGCAAIHDVVELQHFVVEHLALPRVPVCVAAEVRAIAIEIRVRLLVTAQL